TFILRMERKVDNQVAAPAETRTPNLHRAKIAHRRVRMEGWRQCWRLGRREKSCPTKKQKNPLDSDRSSHGRPLHSESPAGTTIIDPAAADALRCSVLQGANLYATCRLSSRNDF